MVIDKPIKDLKVFSAIGMATFKGFITNGLDSSTLINLIVVFDSKFEEYKKRGFTFPPNLFCYHEVSVPEVIGILINKHGFTKDEAKEALRKLVNEFSLTKIIRIQELDAPFEKLVEETNIKVVSKYNNNPNLTIGDQDIIIIAGFLRNNVNFVHSADEGFLKTCEELKINTIPTPKRDLERENEIKKWLKRKK
ncbi:MAG: hypothetical protein Q8R04_05755 [Nanoarchaeota archaeon]|nr:hypothetical protein [Nanoarchaeota archaeon]